MYTLSANASWFDASPSERYFLASKNGFSALEELIWTKLNLESIKSAIDESGVKNSAILIGTGDEKNASLISNGHGLVWEDSSEAFKSALTETLSVAKRLNVSNIVVTSGNERKDVPRSVQHKNIVSALSDGAKILEGSGVRLVLEPLNVKVNHKGYYLVNTSEAVDIIKEVDSPCVKVLYDIYHQQISEGNVIDTIRENIEYIGHFHAADVPGRLEPGTGELNYKNIFKAIADTGYSGYVTFECGKSTNTETVCQRMISLI